MKHLTPMLLLATAIITTHTSCKKSLVENHAGQEEGVIQKQGFTTYQYGTHLLVQDATHQLVLKSNTINLDNYLGKKVRISATRNDKMPENGPPLYTVNMVKEIP